MATTSPSDLSPAVKQELAMKMLSLPTPNLIHKDFAIKDVLEVKNGDTKRYRLYNKFMTATAPLAGNGAPVAGKTLTATDIDAKIDYYGDWAGVSEQVFRANQEKTLNEASLILGLQMRETEDELIRDVLESTPSQVNCVNGTNGDNPTEWTSTDSLQVQVALMNNVASMYLGGVEGADLIGSTPVRNSFVAMAHTRLCFDLDRSPDFQSSTEYSNQMKVLPGEWGAVRNIRYFVSPRGSISENDSALNADVANTFVAGKESYACIKQGMDSIQFLYNPAYLSDELHQTVSLGWKMIQVPLLLRPEWLFNLRSSLQS
jgi:N4-gp56 family major capsid protein